MARAVKRKKASGIEELVRVMARLRAPGGCPWDREQDHRTLMKYALEEVYELKEAVEEGSDEKMLEELGDLLLQVVFHAQMAKERGAFDFDAVARRITRKLIERHPHVFGKVKVKGSREVIANWEAIKRKEKKTTGQKASRVGGLPKSLPALLMAFRIAEKVPDAVRKIRRKASRRSPDIGDELLALALRATHQGIDPEHALRRRCLEWIEEIDRCPG